MITDTSSGQFLLFKPAGLGANRAMLRRVLPFVGLLAVIGLYVSCAPPQRSVPTPDLPPAQIPGPQTSRAAPSDILILGDSQISFGAGGPYTDFFGNLAANCPAIAAGFPKARAAAIGVRSTALHHWTTSQSSARAPLCAVDEKFGVNAGAYGVTSPGLSYVQIGQDAAYPFCPPGRPALPAATTALDPDLLILAFLGNAQERWQSSATVRADWAAAEAQIPAHTACIVMTTIPGYDPATNARRAQAQSHLAAAVAATNRCAFVPGITPDTRTRFEGNASYFRTNEAGVVSDPTHPTARSAEAFVAMKTPALCAAVAQALQN